MSADNFMLIRRHEDLFVVTMEFASDDEVRPIRQRPDGTFEGGMTRAFDNYSDALDYAHSEWTEYGVEDDTATDVVTEERNAIIAICEKWETVYSDACEGDDADPCMGAALAGVQVVKQEIKDRLHV